MQSSTTVGQPVGPPHPADDILAGRSRPPLRAPGVTWPRLRLRPGRGTGYRVLCIDDDPQVLAVLEEHFFRNGFDVDIALDGTSGLALALAHEYHAMVVDLRLTPVMTGLGVIRAVRLENRMTAIVVLTGYPSHETAIEATHLGAIYLAKADVSMASVVDVVRNAIAANVPAVRPLFRTSPGPSVPVLDLVRTIDEVKARLHAVNADLLRHELGYKCARVLPWFDLTFLEFVAVADAFRMQNDPVNDIAIVLPIVAEHLDTAARRVWTDVDPRVRRVVDALLGAGHNWKTIEEAAAATIAGVDVDKLHELLSQEFSLSWPRTRWSVVLRRAVLELAATDEQVAQIAFKVGFAHATRLNGAFDKYFGTTPTEYRKSLRGGDGDVSGSEEKRKE